MNISPRLKMIAKLADGAEILADIGTDHGYLPIYLLINGKIKKAVVSDINEMPLQKAVENAEKYGVSEKVSPRLANGLEGIKNGETDTVVIAGMGGDLIAEILKYRVKHVKKYILQPMSKIEELRRSLNKADFKMTDERLVKERGKLYHIIVAENGRQNLSEFRLRLPAFLKTEPLYGEYLDKMIKKMKKAVKQLENTENNIKLEEFRMRLNELEKEKISLK